MSPMELLKDNLPVMITGTTYRPPLLSYRNTLVYFQQLVDDSFKLGDPVDQALNLYISGCKAQLFLDGNKRTSLLMANKWLLNFGQGILLLPIGNLYKDYMVKLKQFYEGNLTSSEFVCYLTETFYVPVTTN